jgi:MFS family permease
MRGYKEVTAAYTTQGSKILPMLASPLIGLAVDRWGGRFIMMVGLLLCALLQCCPLTNFCLLILFTSPLLWIIAMATIQFSDVHPLLPVIIGSLASCIQALPFQFAMPYVLPPTPLVADSSGVTLTCRLLHLSACSCATSRRSGRHLESGNASTTQARRS